MGLVEHIWLGQILQNKKTINYNVGKEVKAEIYYLNSILPYEINNFLKKNQGRQ